MSGHNKWSQIKRQKAVVDSARSKVFAKYSKEISLASRETKGDINSPLLRNAIERARAANMPKENIDRAVRRGAGLEGGALVGVVYEAYGPGGVAILIAGITNNSNRTSAEIKHILSEHGLSLGTPGSVTWAFKKEGLKWSPTTTVSLSSIDKEKLSSLTSSFEEHEDVEAIYTNEQ